MTLTTRSPTNKVFQIFLILMRTSMIGLRRTPWRKARHKKVYTCTLPKTAICRNRTTAKLRVRHLKQMKDAPAAWPSKMLYRLILVKYTPIILKCPLNDKLINFNTLPTNNKTNKNTKHTTWTQSPTTIQIVIKYPRLLIHIPSVFRNLTNKIKNHSSKRSTIKRKSLRNK